MESYSTAHVVLYSQCVIALIVGHTGGDNFKLSEQSFLWVLVLTDSSLFYPVPHRSPSASLSASALQRRTSVTICET